jgi:hypothetical protein
MHRECTTREGEREGAQGAYHEAEVRPQGDEVAVGEDGVRLRELLVDQSHDVRQLRLVLVRNILNATALLLRLRPGGVGAPPRGTLPPQSTPTHIGIGNPHPSHSKK